MALNRDDLQRQSIAVLGEPELALLRPLGEIRPTRTGDVLFEAGDPSDSLAVVLSGRTEIIHRSDGSETFIRSTGPGEFAGELGLLTGQTRFSACVVREAGEVLIVPRAAVQHAIATIPELSDVLVTALAARRQLLMSAAASTLTLIAPDTSASLERLQEFTDRNRIPYRCLSPEDPAAVAILERFAVDAGDTLWVVVRGQKLLADPSNLEVAQAIGLDLTVDHDAPADLIVIGAGPAGLSAAVYGASEGLVTIVVDEFGIGGQAGTSSRIENYLGFPTGISGGDLAFRAEVQALKFGARVTVPRQAMSLTREDGLFAIGLNDGTTLRGRSLVVATGAHYRSLGLPEQERFAGIGVHYAATELEARLCRDAGVIVVGAGNSAGQAAMFLSGVASTVHLVCRGPDLARSMSRYLVSRLEYTPNVRIHTGCVVQALRGQRRLESVTIADAQGNLELVSACAVFAMIGADPCTDWLRDTIELDAKGFIVTGTDVTTAGGSAVPSPFQTSHPGVFAVGDVRSGSVKRVASAVGEGSVVVQAVHRYLAEI
jgi:thioredoxin reductase (NADPH)